MSDQTTLLDPPRARLVYCHHEGAEEQEAPLNCPVGYWSTWQWAVCQVDTRQGGYVRELDAAGRLVREHASGKWGGAR